MQQKIKLKILNYSIYNVMQQKRKQSFPRMLSGQKLKLKHFFIKKTYMRQKGANSFKMD